jgi:hypothetical protein
MFSLIPGSLSINNNEPVIEETQTSRGKKPMAIAHAIAAAARKQEEEKKAFDRVVTVTAELYTDLHRYEPGDTVSGKLYVHCKSLPGVKSKTIRTLLEGKHVEIEVSGNEKVSWLCDDAGGAEP